MMKTYQLSEELILLLCMKEFLISEESDVWSRDTRESPASDLQN